MSDQADQTIVVRFLVEANDAIKKGEELKAATIAVKEQLKELAKTSNLTYKEMAAGMEKAFASQKWSQLSQRMILDPEAMKVAVAQTKAEIHAYAVAVKTALAEINTEVRTSSTIWNDAKKGEALVAKDTAKQIADAEKATAQAKKQATQAWIADSKQQAMAMKELESTAKTSSSSTKSLFSSLAGTALAVAGITSVIAVVQKLTGYLKEAAQAGKEFAQATFSMVVGVRALQRAGVDITIADVTAQIQSLKKEFGVFVTKDLVVGTAAFLNLIRDMGATKDQIFQLQDAIATLAVVNGRSMDEVQKTVALALSSGYTEGLQRLGVSINRVNIAEEAATMGWKNGYTALSEHQRYLATFNLVIRKTNLYLDDMLDYQKELPGQIDTTTASLQDQKNMIGEELLPVWLELLKTLLDVVELFHEDIVLPFAGYSKDRADYIKIYGEELEGITNVWTDYWFSANKKVQDAALVVVEEATKEYNELSARLRAEMGDEAFEDLTPQEIFARRDTGLGDVPVADLADEERAAAVASVLEDQLDEIKSIQEDFQNDSKQAWEDYQQDLEEIDADHFRRREELFIDYLRELSELGREHQRRIDEMVLENERRVADIGRWYDDSIAALALEEASGAASIWANYYNSLASAEASYRNRQIDAEIKYQETLLKLREGFLLDLEDALQARDARQVLKLIRRYNLEKDQAERAFDQEMDRLRREHEERLAELARQRDERLRQFYEEMAAKRAALELEHQRKLDDEKRRFEQEQAEEELRDQQQREDAERNWGYAKEDEARRYEQDKLDRDARYVQELLDLDAHLASRYEKIATALGEELGYTDEMMEAIRVALNDTLGPGGEADAIYTYYTQRAVAAMQAAAGAIAYMTAMEDFGLRHPNWFPSSTNPYDSNFTTPDDKPIKSGFASGGLAYADRATDVTFGEAGPELAAFVPLKDVASIPSALANLGKGMGAPASGGGSMRIELWLDRYLEGRIVDSAVDNVADVILRRFRQ